MGDLPRNRAVDPQLCSSGELVAELRAQASIDRAVESVVCVCGDRGDLRLFVGLS